MGTRNVTVIKLDNKVILTKYCQWDGYPTGQGLELCNFIKNDLDLRKLKKNIKTVQIREEEELDGIFDDYLEKRNILEKSFTNSFENMDKEHKARRALQVELVPLITRDTGGGDILKAIQDRSGLLIGDVNKGNLDYAKGIEDGFGCEYVYEVDLDKKQVAIFDGLYKGKPSAVYSFTKLRRAKDVGKLMDKLQTRLSEEYENLQNCS
jgi:hypothetical protein